MDTSTYCDFFKMSKKSLFLKYLILACALFHLFPLFSQTHYFEKTFGTTGNDFSRSVKQLADGSIYLFGNTDSGMYGGNDFSLTKLDRAGNQLWTKYYGTSSSENGLYLNTTSDQQLIFTGESVTSISTDILIYKVDTSGQVIWQKTYATLLNESANYIEQTKDGGYIIAGAQNDSAGYYDLFALKLNADGDYQWHRTYGPNKNEYAKMIHETADGFILSGDTGDSLNNYDVAVYHLDTFGNKIWYKNYGDSLANGTQGIMLTADGNYLFYGETEIAPGSLFDSFLQKIDKNGNTLWKKFYGGAGADAIFSVTEETDGGFVCTGYSNSYNNNHPLDLIILKTDPVGKLLWQQTYGTDDIDIGYEVIKSVDEKGYILTGTTSASANDYYLLKLNDEGIVTNIADVTETALNLFSDVYPNPSSESIYIHYKLHDTGKNNVLVIYDVTGCQLKTMVLNNQTGIQQIDIQNFLPGIYFCSLLADNKLIHSKKFLIVTH